MNSIYANMTAIRQLTFSIFALLLTWAAATAQPLTTSWIFDGNVLTGTSNQTAATANNATYGTGVTGSGLRGRQPQHGASHHRSRVGQW